MINYNKNNFKLLLILFSIILLITGCNNKNTNSTQSKISNTIKTDIISEDDTLDPENTDFNNQTGKKIDYSALHPQTGKANGIDVSKWQGKIDWNKVKSSGIDFAIIRIGYRGENGIIYKDTYADYNIQQADKAGVLIGVYFFSNAINSNEAKEEAEWTKKAISCYPISYPVVYDCENFSKSISRMYNVSSSERTENIITFLSTITNEGYEGMLYAPYSELSSSVHWDINSISTKYKIWIARYSDTTYPQVQIPEYNGKYDMWQYTNMGEVNGVSGNVDLNVAYFNKQKASPKSSDKIPQASTPTNNDSNYTSVNDKVMPKELVNLRESASTKSNIIATVKNGEFITRTGIGNNGWSRLVYKDKTVYAITSYLTTDSTYAPPKTESQQPDDGFTPASGQLTAKDTVNLRDKPSTSGNKVATITNGTFVARTGIGANGWTRLNYNGSTVYAVTSYLTTEINKPASSTVSSENIDTNKMQFKDINDKVTAKENTNLRSTPSSVDDSNIVYLLKNGEYVQRTGTSDYGWSRLIYNGQTVYAKTSLLTN